MVSLTAPEEVMSKSTYWKKPPGVECVWVPDISTFSAVYRSPYSLASCSKTWNKGERKSTDIHVCHSNHAQTKVGGKKRKFGRERDSRMKKSDDVNIIFDSKFIIAAFIFAGANVPWQAANVALRTIQQYCTTFDERGWDPFKGLGPANITPAQDSSLNFIRCLPPLPPYLPSQITIHVLNSTILTNLPWGGMSRRRTWSSKLSRNQLLWSAQSKK